MAIAASEYGYDLPYFARMLDAGGVDNLQADVTRCAGITELLRVDALRRARSMPLPLHCGPAIHLHAGLRSSDSSISSTSTTTSGSSTCCSTASWIGARRALAPDLTRPGDVLELKRTDAERHATARKRRNLCRMDMAWLSVLRQRTLATASRAACQPVEGRVGLDRVGLLGVELEPAALGFAFRDRGARASCRTSGASSRCVPVSSLG
jgi:hypothetical protein